MKSSTLTAKKNEGFFFSLTDLYPRLAGLEDPRARRGKRYRQADVLLIFLLAKLSGEDTPSGIAEWAQHRQATLRTALGIAHHRLPHHSTYRRLLGENVNPDELEAEVGAYLSSKLKGPEVLIALDGKTVRGTIPSGETQGTHLLAAFVPEEGLVLMQMAVDQKENEIRVAPRLLKCLDLRQKIVMGDALNAQKPLSAQIVSAGGNYLWILKDNHPRTRSAIRQLFEPPEPKPGFGRIQTDFQQARQSAMGHGRSECRTLTSSSMLNTYLNWPEVAQVFRLERQVTHLASGEISTSVVYGLTSLTAEQASPQRLLHLTRQYWGIENGLHYRRDVSFREDATRMTKGHLGQVMATMNNLVLGIIVQAGFSYVPAGRRYFSAHWQKTLPGGGL